MTILNGLIMCISPRLSHIHGILMAFLCFLMACEYSGGSLNFFSVSIDPMLFKVGGNIGMQYILHDFEFQPDGTFNCDGLLWSQLSLSVF